MRQGCLERVNEPLLKRLNPGELEVVLCRVEEAEIDEMWRYVGSKAEPRWLWHAIDQRTGSVLAYVFGRRKDEVFLALKELLKPFGITRYDTDYLGTYQRHLDPEVHCPGKRHTQKIERQQPQVEDPD